MIGTLFAKLKAEAGFLVLLAVAAAGAWLYVQFQQVRADRDDVVHRAELVCAGLGVKWTASHGGGTGAACADRARQLRADREEIDRQSVRLFADAMSRAKALTDADAKAAREALARANAAETRMEAANANADANDHVGADWIAALNDLAGLRRPPR